MTTTSPSFTKEIAFDRFTKDYTATVDGQLIGSFSTHHEAEVAADEHVFNLLSDGMHIPATALDGQCGDCGAVLDNQGLCGCRAEEVTYFSSIAPDPFAGDLLLTATEREITPSFSCICGQPAFILESHGTYCGACHEASDLWTLWKTDSTAFVSELRRQSCRLNEMAARLCVYLNAKNESALGCDSILAMWRQLLDDGEPPEPRFYVVARQQVAA